MSYRKNFVGTQKRVRMSHGKRAIGVRAIEVRLCMGHVMRKCILGHMPTAKVQLSLRICAVWSGPSLSANRIIGHYRMNQWTANARMRLCACVGWIWICAFCACSKTPFRLAKPIYSWLSLSRTRLSRITAYLEVKIWSLPKHEKSNNNKILWKRGEIAPKEQFLLFSTIFSIYL